MKIIITDRGEVERILEAFAESQQRAWLWFSAEVRWAPTEEEGIEIMVDKVDREARHE